MCYFVNFDVRNLEELYKQQSTFLILTLICMPFVSGPIQECTHILTSVFCSGFSECWSGIGYIKCVVYFRYRKK